MKCGGQALDLPVANRVIIVDIWWNKTVEQQAFKRVHRIGQKEETHLVRIMARGSIDERLYMLQNAKQAIVNRALQDDGHIPDFTETQALQWLFSDKSEDDLIQDMDAKARAKKGKAKGKKKA
jgi:SNF2 family DNA or RNA helicase